MVGDKKKKGPTTKQRKESYFAKAKSLINDYNKIVIVNANNVGSLQLQKIRIDLRGKAVVLMGKNTMMRKIISDVVAAQAGHPINNLLPLIVGNIGLIFTNDDFGLIQESVKKNRVGAPARVGQIAENDVIVPPGPTGCDPGQTQWFQALNVPTKINKGQIEIVSELKLIKTGQRVGGSEAALLQKLNIKPFSYGLVLVSVYDNGSVYDAKVLSISQDNLRTKFFNGLRRAAAICLAAGYPTSVSLPHSVGNGVRNLIAISAASGYSFDQMEQWNKLLSMDPAELAKLQAASAAGGAAGAGGAAPAAGKAAEKEKEEEKEVEVDLGGGGLFGGGEGAKY